MSSDTSKRKLNLVPNEQLRYYRKKQCWTQTDLADKLYSMCEIDERERGVINTNMVSRWERGEFPPSPFWQKKLCELFEESPEELGLIAKPDGMVQMPSLTMQPVSVQPSLAYRKIGSIPPLTDSRTIHQRENAVKEVYSKLIQSNITSVALTGISGSGKSTLAALIYDYVEKQRSTDNGPFSAETLWLRIDPSVTMADIIGNIFEALTKPIPDLNTLSPQNQAAALFTTLNMVDNPRLIILDQFENLLDWKTGYALSDRIGISEWIDALNNQPNRCRILLTSHLRPQGTREYPPTYMQEYQCKGMEVTEGMEMLRKQGIEETEQELRTAVERCNGHAFALTLLASLLQKWNLTLAMLLEDPSYTQLWTGKAGKIARNLLDTIYLQKLDDIERNLLLAFSVYREPVSLSAALAVMDFIPKVSLIQTQVSLETLLAQHLIQASSRGRYQLHAIVATYAKYHFVEDDEHANELALQSVHTRAGQYYQKQVAMTCPPKNMRQGINDVQPLIEAVWQYCLAAQQQKAYELILEENLFEDLKRWGGNVILLELYQLLLQSDRWQPERLQRAQIYNDLGWVYSDLGQKQQALKYYQQALKISEELENNGEKGRALSNIGRVYDSLGNKIQAREYFEQALRIYQETRDHRGEAWILNNLGKIYTDLKQVGTALEYLQQALHIRREIEDHNGVGRTLNNLGRLYMKLGDHEKALQSLKEALLTLRELGDRHGQSRALHRIGQLYSILNQQEEALTYYRQALNIRKEIGDHRGEGRVLDNTGLTYAKLGQHKQAWKQYKQALSICRVVEDRETEGNVLDHLGLLYLERCSFNIALACFFLSKSIFEKIDNSEVMRIQDHIESLRQKAGEEHFAKLSVQINLKAQQIVDQALIEGP